ncbi:MAG: EAL domain-containing protein [Gammaproteobacteria bacterium]|nr:EAL domain-containing protein [Gammaproteobacteria bacterium]
MSKSLKVLFIEDSVEDAKLAVAELVRGGFQTYFERVDSPVALQIALEKFNWDLLICDFSLLQINAEQALKLLDNSNKDIPFIVLTRSVKAEDAVNLMRRGAQDFLSKETLVRLVPAVERELREVAERRKRRKAEKRLKTLSLAVEQSPVSVAITDQNGIIEYVNPKFEEITKFQFAEAIGRNLDFTVVSHSTEGIFNELWETVQRGKNWTGEFCNLKKDGEIFWEYANIAPLVDSDGLITNFVAVKEDITARRNYEEQLLRQSHYDDLTGLANRVLMLDRLDIAIKAAHRNNEQVALFCIDLDGFKNVNDTLGHSVGDDLLREAATRLGTCIRGCDTLARMGGDEFVVILPQIRDDIVVRRIADRILSAFAEVFEINGNDHFVTASIGIVLFPNDGKDNQVLLRNADLAMYKAKDLGRNRYQFFTEEINQKLKERMYLETRLRKVIVQGELVLHYQPIVDMQNHLPVAYEALVRWRQCDGELYMPASFIPLAEDVGLISEIGEWVVSTACAEVSSRRGQPQLIPRIAINVSPKQLQVKGFAAYIKRQLIDSGLQPEQLDLEITERVLVDDEPETHINLKFLCDFGVSLSIDDFGTGYSSLGYLQKYPFSTLKIDRGFISRVIHDKNSARLVEAIISMAHGLGLKVIAEGVETAEQLSFLLPTFCDQVQGFYFSPPLPAESLPYSNKSLLPA